MSGFDLVSIKKQQKKVLDTMIFEIQLLHITEAKLSFKLYCEKTKHRRQMFFIAVFFSPFL